MFVRKLFWMSLLSLSLLGCATKSKQWSENSTFSNPESAYFHSSSGFVFVSNVSGGALEKDGKGWISKLNQNGEVINARWFTGLNAPKGLRGTEKVLWVSDIDRVVSIDIATGKKIHEIKINSAKFLNDVAIDSSGAVYVSDTIENKIFKITDGKVSFFLKGPSLEAPNRLLINGSNLYIATWGLNLNPKDFSTSAPGRILKADLKTKKITPISERLGNLDGIERMENGDFLVSDWAVGKVFRWTSSGEKKLIYQSKQGTADIGYIPSSQTILVPEMVENRIVTLEFD